MKKLQHVLPCGRVVAYYEHTPRDVGNVKEVSRRLRKNRKLLDSLTSFRNHGRNYSRWCPSVFHRFSTFLVEHLVDLLIEGNRIKTNNGHVWMIAPRKDAGKHINWHTDGKSYGVVIRGLNGNFGIRLSKKRRRELQQKIESGRMYHA